MDRNSFVFYKEWMEAISDLSDDIRLEIYESIIVYATSGDLPVLKPMAKVAFNFIKAAIDRDTEKYIDMVEKNRANGLRGGRPKKENPKKAVGLKETHPNPTKAKKADNDNDNDNGINTKKESAKADEKERATDVATLSPDYVKFLDWMKRKAPFCNNPKNFTHGITEDEFYTLKEKYSGKELADIIEQIENRKDLRKRYTNLYRTVLNWIKKEKQ